MATDEQILKDFKIVKRCENCEHRGATRYDLTGDGGRAECWCKLRGNPGPVFNLYGQGCDKWQLVKWIRDNYEAERKGKA
jgi:hypothetical protein